MNNTLFPITTIRNSLHNVRVVMQPLNQIRASSAPMADKQAFAHAAALRVLPKEQP